MAANLLVNVRQALNGMPVAGSYGWLDSTVALQWLRGGGAYKQFVMNCVNKIQVCPNITWRYVPCRDSPADLGSHGRLVSRNQMWWEGPSLTTATPESVETKATKAVFNIVVESLNESDQILARFLLNKAVRIHAWIFRFLHNCRAKRTETERRSGKPVRPVSHIKEV